MSPEQAEGRADRSPYRHLLVRLRAVRSRHRHARVQRASSVERMHRVINDEPEPVTDRAAALAARASAHRPQVPRQGSGRALPVDEGRGHRSARRSRRELDSTCLVRRRRRRAGDRRRLPHRRGGSSWSRSRLWRLVAAVYRLARLERPRGARRPADADAIERMTDGGQQRSTRRSLPTASTWPTSRRSAASKALWLRQHRDRHATVQLVPASARRATSAAFSFSRTFLDLCSTPSRGHRIRAGACSQIPLTAAITAPHPGGHLTPVTWSPDGRAFTF